MTTVPEWPLRSLDECNKLLTAPGSPWETEHKVIKGRPLTVYKHLPHSLRDFWLATKPFADAGRDYVIYEGERLTYRQAHIDVNTVAEMYRRRGITKGDRVAICMRNYPEWIVCFWACHMLGAVAVAVNAWSPLEPLTHCLTNSGCKLAIVDAERAAILVPSMPALRASGCQAILVVRGEQKGPGFERFEDAIKGCEGVALPAVDITPEDNATIFFTSGTTSLPKGVLATQRQFLSNKLNTSIATVRTALRKGLGFPVPDPNAIKAVLLSIPLFHVTGNQSLLIQPTSLGGKVVLMRKWDLKEAVTLIRQEKITTAGGVPFIVSELIESELGEDQNHTLEGFSFGGAPSSSQLPRILKERMPQVLLSTAYGLSESNAVSTSHSGEDYALRPKSCGLPPPVVEIKIMCLTNKTPLAIGSTGEIYLRGPNIAQEYWKSPKATAEAFSPDGWFQTGDVGHLDESGFLYISDRAKEIIIRGGENISTISVEDVLYADPRIKDTAVVPVPDRKLGELVAAIVVVKPEYSGKVTEAELQAHVAKSLPRHCVPVMILFRDELPRNPSGKILKKDLKVEASKVWEDRTKVLAKL